MQVMDGFFFFFLWSVWTSIWTQKERWGETKYEQLMAGCQPYNEYPPDATVPSLDLCMPVPPWQTEWNMSLLVAPFSANKTIVQ